MTARTKANDFLGLNHKNVFLDFQILSAVIRLYPWQKQVCEF
jgi:hypothetical protein